MRVFGRNNKAIPLNHNLYDTWTIHNAWVLGLLTSDGSFGKIARPQEFKLYSTDFELLNAFRSVLDTEKKITVSTHTTGRMGKKPVGYMILSSPQIINFLKSINGHGEKDLRNPFNFIPEEYRWAFIKGLFDGDGCVYKSQFIIAGRINLITEIYAWLCQKIEKKPNKLYKSTGTDKTVFFQMGKADSQKVMLEIQENASGTYDSAKFLKLCESFAS